MWLLYISYFFGGVFLTNSIPHVVNGTMGRAFQTPFAKPPGKGLSSSTVNVVWGVFNVVMGYVLICRVGAFDLRSWDGALAAGLGGLAMAVFSARTFGELHGGNSPSRCKLIDMSVIIRGRALIAGGLYALSGCASAVTTSPNLESVQSIRTVAVPSGLQRGLYVLSPSGIDGFSTDNRKNARPFCSLGGISSGVQSIAFDRKGNMIVPDYNASTITVYGAPTTGEACGKIIGVIQDPFGQPVDAASLDAVTGRIAVVAFGEVDICSLRHGCTKSLQASYLDEVASVALSRDGDCWAEADATSGPGVLYYFKGCNSDGQLTTGYYGDGDNYGGLDIDKYGNIVSIYANYHNTPAIYVYSGCNPTCAPVSGPLPLVGNGTYGHLNNDSTEFAVADTQFSSIDVYKFTPTSLRFEYSFNGGLSGIEGVAYNPRAK